MLLRLCAAAILGGLVGLERERVEAAAGLRTHALVAVGAALLMLVSMFGFTDAGRPPGVVLDPSRVAAQIVSGIGFLGAGVIIFRKEIVRGLTTAASIWVVAAIGMATGGGLYVAAVGATVIALAILAIMKPIERRLVAARRPQILRLVVDGRRVSASDVRSLLLSFGAEVERIEARLSADSSKNRLFVVLKRISGERLLQLAERLSTQPGIRQVRSVIDATDVPHKAAAYAPTAAQPAPVAPEEPDAAAVAAAAKAKGHKRMPRQ